MAGVLPLGSRSTVKKPLSLRVARIRFAVGAGISSKPAKSVDLKIGLEKIKSKA